MSIYLILFICISIVYTIEVQMILLEVQTGTHEVQTIGIGFNSKFKSGGAGEMDLLVIGF